MELRPATGADKDGIIALIDGVFREYDDSVCLEKVDGDLLDLAAHYGEGLFMVLDDGGHICGTVALVPLRERPGVCHLRRLYLEAHLRGGGWGARMMDWACSTAQAMGMEHMEFWSDTRFDRAHAFYEKLGFHHDGTIRAMNDGWKPYQERFFFGDL